MSLGETLDEYNKAVGAWLEQCDRQTKAVQKLKKAVATGSLRDVEKLRAAAVAASETAHERADACLPWDFEAAAYLAGDGAFLPELKEAAERAGVRLQERDGVVFCYPVLVRLEPDLAAVRIDKRLEYNVRPETLADLLKKAQSRDPKAKPAPFIEALYSAYEFVRAQDKMAGYGDVPLRRIYDILTLLPGADKDYTLLDFTRDVYFLDISGVTETRKGVRIIFAGSTVSHQKSTKTLQFVTRDGQEKDYSSVVFKPGT